MVLFRPSDLKMLCLSPAFRDQAKLYKNGLGANGTCCRNDTVPPAVGQTLKRVKHPTVHSMIWPMIRQFLNLQIPYFLKGKVNLKENFPIGNALVPSAACGTDMPGKSFALDVTPPLRRH